MTRAEELTASLIDGSGSLRRNVPQMTTGNGGVTELRRAHAGPCSGAVTARHDTARSAKKFQAWLETAARGDFFAASRREQARELVAADAELAAGGAGGAGSRGRSALRADELEVIGEPGRVAHRLR